MNVARAEHPDELSRSGSFRTFFFGVRLDQRSKFLPVSQFFISQDSE